MKKLLMIVLIAMMIVSVFALAACSSPQPAADTGEVDNDPPASGDTAAEKPDDGNTEVVDGVTKFRVGLECNYAPFNWTQTTEDEKSVPIPEGGYAGGYDVEIAKRIANGLGLELEIVKTEWDGLIPALQTGKIDAVIAGMSPTDERKATVDFTDPYYESVHVIVVKKDGAYAGATSLEDFSGAKITGQLNTFHYEIIDQIPGVDKQTALETFPAMIVALQSGKIDGYVSERPGAVSAVASNSDLTFIEFEEGKGFEVSPEDAAIAVALPKGSGMLDSINKIIATISEDKRQQIMNEAVEDQPLSE